VTNADRLHKWLMSLQQPIMIMTPEQYAALPGEENNLWGNPFSETPDKEEEIEKKSFSDSSQPLAVFYVRQDGREVQIAEATPLTNFSPAERGRIHLGVGKYHRSIYPPKPTVPLLPKIMLIEEEEKPEKFKDFFKIMKGEPDADVPSIIEGPRPQRPAERASGEDDLGTR
jgi:hypothetical protein